MRIRFVVLSVLIGCLALLLGLGEGRTQNPGARPADRERNTRPQRPRIPAPGADASTSWIDERFYRLDRNGDGILTVDEMTENLKIELAKWDVNGDSMIDLDEWRAYVKAVIAHRRRTAAAAGNGPRGLGQKPGQKPGSKPRIQKPRRRPRAQGAARPPFRNQRNKGTSPHTYKLPSNLPAWFKEYDTDGDGQISFHEWKAKEDNEKEFLKYDLNGDGFITLEELIRSGQFFTNTNKPTPQRANGLRAEVGEFFYLEVTGTTGGGIWGTDIYTADSLISTAAVHAGVLREGETGFVKVTILPGQTPYPGTTRNGVTSRFFGSVFPRSYRVQEIPR